ncbi:MAG: hypothetical protein M0030_11090 [Actinomycetota bacterium]|nr:hypothetical protein [Actinomycetota bacterium]
MLRDLASIEAPLSAICGRLAGCLARFDGYASAYSAALGKARAGYRDWVDGPDRASCHSVWIQFHEDLLATLGLPRGAGA